MFVIRTPRDVFGTTDARSALQRIVETRDAGGLAVAHGPDGRPLSADDLARLVVYSDREVREPDAAGPAAPSARAAARSHSISLALRAVPQR